MADNPSGSVLDVSQKLESLMFPEPEGQPEEVAEPVEQVEAEEVPVEAEAEAVEVEDVDDPEQPDEESWELPGTVDELAEALGIEAEQLLNLRVREKVNGEEREATLAELRSGHMKDADYRQKTERLAEERKAHEAEIAQKQAEWNARIQESVGLISEMENMLKTDLDAVNWQQLREEDPAEYAARQQDARQRLEQIERAKLRVGQSHQQQMQEQQQQAQAQYQEYLQEQKNLLLEKMPEWRDESKLQSDFKEMQSYLTGYGFTAEEMQAVADHRQIMLIQKAMQLDKLQKSKPEVTKRVVKAPKLAKPGTRKSSADAKTETRIKLRNRLKKTGSVKDAAAFFESMYED